MNEPYVSSTYLHDIYDPARGSQLLAWLQKVLEPRRRDFDVIAFRGSSGVPALAAGLILGIPCIHVRKEQSHAGQILEGAFAGPRVAIVDDLVCSGDTLREIHYRLKHNWPTLDGPPPRITHVFLYAQAREGCDRKVVWHTLGNPAVICRLRHHTNEHQT